MGEGGESTIYTENAISTTAWTLVSIVILTYVVLLLTYATQCNRAAEMALTIMLGISMPVAVGHLVDRGHIFMAICMAIGATIIAAVLMTLAITGIA